MKTKLLLQVIVLSFLFLQNASSQVTSNFRVHPGSVLQVETPLSASPQNSQVFAGASITDHIPGGYSLGFYITTNSGLNWTGTNSIAPPNDSTGGNPSVAINSAGKIVMSYLSYSSGKYSVKVSASTNNGANWLTPVAVPGVDNADKDYLAIDNSPTSAYYGNMYIVYKEFTNSFKGIYFSKSTDSGVSWSTAVGISFSGGKGTPSIAIGKNGEIYVCFVNGFNYNTYVGFMKSTNGGDNWTNVTNLENGTFNYQYFTDNVLIAGVPYIACDKNNGNIYITSWGTTNIDTYDILVYTSTNQGSNWNTARANSDNTGSNKHQFFPFLSVDNHGGVNVLYYDARNTPTNDSCQVYLSRSMDSGKTFNNYLISDHKFYLKQPVHTGHQSLFQFNEFIGTYPGLASNNQQLQCLWYDNFTGNYQAWTASFKFGPFISHTQLSNTTQLGNIPVNCQIIPIINQTNSSNTKLYWSRNSTTSFSAVTMTNSSGNYWSATIPGDGTESTYRYYIKTEDLSGNKDSHPDRAPVNFHTFLTRSDLSGPVISHTPLTNQPKENFPPQVNATVTDFSGVDSVWVVWSKNSGIKKQFKLASVSSNLYSAFFNEINSYVNYGDKIRYKIFAKDNALNQNIDSTSLILFTIENYFLCEDFVNVSFPPSNWNIEYSGTNYWSESDFGHNGSKGSVKFDFYNAHSGTVQSLTTATFNSTSSTFGDALRFNYAHAERSSSVDADTLLIESSTDNGSTYSELAVLFGRELNTEEATKDKFVPGTEEWMSKEYPVPAGTNKVKFTAKAGGGNNLYLDNICIQEMAEPANVSVKVIPQGFYNLSTNRLNSKDTIRAYFKNQGSPFLSVDSAIGILDSVTFTVNFLFPNMHTGYYYLQIKHRNSIETWSSAPIFYDRGNSLTYDFTNSINKAYGNNLVLVGSKYCVFSGDVDQDGNVSLNDLILTNNAANAFVTGYVSTDITGDRFVDLNDIVIVYNNSAIFASVKIPPINNLRPLRTRVKERELSE